MNAAVSYELQNGIGLITLDDGNLNIMSADMLAQIHEVLDQVEQDAQSLVIRGRDSIFSAGFDLKAFSSGPETILKMLSLGAQLVQRLLLFKCPVVSVCTGNTYPMGAFLVMSTDFRIAYDADYVIGMNETAIGLTVPAFAVELARFRLNPAYFPRIVNNAEMLSPKEALTAGLVDAVNAPDSALDNAFKKAQELSKLHGASFAATKQKSYQTIVNSINQAIDSEISLEYIISQLERKGIDH